MEENLCLKVFPNHLPAMVKASRIQEKARGVGFDWENINQVFEKVKEEFIELHEEVAIIKIIKQK